MGETSTIIRPYYASSSCNSICSYHWPSERLSSHLHSLPPPESQIRLRLLSRLGIHKKVPPASPSDQRRKRTHISSSNNTRNIAPSILKNPITFCEPLKDDDGDDNGNAKEQSTSPSSQSTPASPYLVTLDATKQPKEGNKDEETYSRARRRIQFNSNVMVVPIPSRHAYSKRIKQAFWMDGAEIQATAERNRYEFASEGWDFHQVLEDEDMYVDYATGQLVHPCWVEEEEDEDFEYYSCENEKQTSHLHKELTRDDREQYLDVNSTSLKRTHPGLFGLQDLGDEEKKVCVETINASTESC